MGLEIYFKFILAFALVLVAARLGGELVERFLKQPSVLGELIAGIIISPFALGRLIHDPIILNFAVVENAFGLKEFNVMEVISQIAAVALLFVAGLETDVRAFLKRGISGTAVGAAGVIFPFLFGYLATMKLYPGAGFPGWLFMGAVLTATSVSITVRILMDMGRLRSVEGTTILVAAVIDDIIGIVILSVVISITSTGALEIGHALALGAIGFAVWTGLLLIGVRFRRYISLVLSPFQGSGTMPMLPIIFGYLIAYLVTLVGLHPVVGAYVGGLLFASTQEREEILQGVRPIMNFLAPFFFAYLGMQVNVLSLTGVAILAVVMIILAAAGKVMGCYVAARLAGKLSHTGGLVVAVGMIPRGEVGLIIAGTGLLAGAINRELFGIAVAVSIVTALMTPSILRPLLTKRDKEPRQA